MTLPNLVIGLREGLEAGLVVTILIGAVRVLAPGRSVATVWVGVAGAVAVSLSFGAVLTFTRAELDTRTQQIFTGVTSVLAAGLVTWMVLWMRRAAPRVTGELRGKVSGALAAGGPALAVTALVAVTREGLETALFVWASVQSSGAGAAPLVGALLGLLAAATVCALLYRKVVRVDLGRVFAATGPALLVIVAGVLAYGIGDLQEAGVLPGGRSAAFDVTGQVPTGAWWVETLRGITNLDTRMTWLQVLGAGGYLVIAVAAISRRPRPAPRPDTDSSTGPAAEPVVAVEPVVAAGPVTPGATGPAAKPGWRGLLAAGTALVTAPALVAAGWVALDRPDGTRAAAVPLTVAAASCAAGWPQPTAGALTYAVTNSSGHAADVELLRSATGAVLAEIEVLGPGTTRTLTVTPGPGTVHWRCGYDGLPARMSAEHTVPAGGGSAGGQSGTDGLIPATAAELAPVLTAYTAFVSHQLGVLREQVDALRAAVARGERAAARREWLAAHLTYHRVGAAYGAFGELGDAVDGLAQGLPRGTADPGFTGFHRIELDLWSQRPLRAVGAEVAALARAVAALQAALPDFTLDPNEVTLRAHEILEDTQRFTFTGADDYGSGSGYLTAQADLAGTRELVDLLAPLLRRRDPELPDRIGRDLAALQGTLEASGSAGRYPAAGTAPLATRQRVNAAAGRLLEDLAPIPDLLEVRTP